MVLIHPERWNSNSAKPELPVSPAAPTSERLGGAAAATASEFVLVGERLAESGAPTRPVPHIACWLMCGPAGGRCSHTSHRYGPTSSPPLCHLTPEKH